MITLTEDFELYREEIKTLDKKIYRELCFHPDVLRETIRVALCDGRVVGVCYLLAGSSFLSADLKLPAHHLTGDFVSAGADDEEEIESAEVLIDAMKEEALRIAGANPDYRIVLRLWCDVSATDYLDFLCFKGFTVGPVMLIMEKELAPVYDGLSGENHFSEVELPEGMVIRKLSLEDPKEEEAYLLANEDGFGVRDSIGELRYRIRTQEAKIYAVTKGDTVIASVTAWANNSDCASTENIFCRKEYRKKGITKALLNKVLEDLAAEHYDRAALTVYGDNAEAMRLYYSMDYCVVGGHLELQYRPNPSD